MKQVIILRKDLNMRKGKMVAQGSHACLMAYRAAPDRNIDLWLNAKQIKICVGVDSCDELMQLYWLAGKAGLPCSLILDAGLTEFKVPTHTAVAIGPADSSEIDKITGHLKLL